MRERFTQRKVIDALRSARGMVLGAAHQLGCDRRTVQNYITRYPKVREALAQAREGQLDRAELQLFAAIDRGELPAILFYLKTVGRGRGYGDRLAVDAQVDLVTSPEWVRTRTALLGALGPFPEARMAVVGALRALAAPQTDGVAHEAGDGGEDGG